VVTRAADSTPFVTLYWPLAPAFHPGRNSAKRFLACTISATHFSSSHWHAKCLGSGNLSPKRARKEITLAAATACRARAQFAVRLFTARTMLWRSPTDEGNSQQCDRRSLHAVNKTARIDVVPIHMTTIRSVVDDLERPRQHATSHVFDAGMLSGSTVLLPMLLLGALLVALAAPAHAALYKWTDERGAVHYSDKIPPESVNRPRYELNRQGMTIRKTEPARPVVQKIPKTEDEEQKIRQAERERVLAERRDRALVESYANEREIDLAKTRAIATIDGQLQSAQAFIVQMQKRREELESKKSTFAPRPVPGSLEREIETIDSEVSRQNEFIAAKRKESAMTAARYDSDKQRFRELRGGIPSGSALTAANDQIAEATLPTLTLTGAPPKR
jgi:hypothetical protein